MTAIDRIITHKKYAVILLAVFIIFSGMRILFINADAPQDLSISAAIFTDEGFKTFAARNFHFFGDWRWSPVDEYGNWFSQSPLGTLSYVLVFHLFGVSFASIRGLSVLYSIATMILFYFFVNRNYDRKTAFIALLLYGLNFFNAMSGRLGFFETHLNFYIMVSLFAVVEMLRKAKEKKIITFIFLFGVSALGITAQYHLKQNFLIIPLAMVPAIMIDILRRKNHSALLMRRVLFVILLSTVLLYLLMGHLSNMQDTFSSMMTVNIFGNPIGHYLPIRLFDPLPSMLGKGLYLEFIFLQPFTFALGIFYSIYAFYSFIENKTISIIEFYSASWLLFGFIFLTLLAYHPSRYYQLLSIPLALCAGRALVKADSQDLLNFFRMKKPVPYNLMTLLLYISLAVYSCVVLLVQLVPFSARSHLMRILYPAFLNEQIYTVLHIIIPVVSLSLLIISLSVIKRASLKKYLMSGGKAGLLLFLILALNMIQYGRWAVSREYKLQETSRALGKELPENAILIGSWSSGFSIENKLRPLIIQAGNTYNYKVIDALLRGEPITAYHRKSGSVKTEIERKIPLYFAVSRNVVFERPILKKYGAVLRKDDIIRTVALGYFDVEIYKMGTINVCDKLK